MAHHAVNSNTTRITFGDLTQNLADAPSRPTFYDDPANVAAIRESVSERLPSGGVLSYDVFDTLVWRDTVSEIRRFWEIATRVHEMLDDDRLTPEDVLLARLDATEVSYRTSPTVDGCREGRLLHIYTLQMRQLNAPKHAVGRGINIELDYEAERLTPNPTLLEIAREHVAEGGRAVLLSDMYMEAEHIRALLGRLNIDLSPFERLVSSADVAVSKHCDGKAFLAMAGWLDAAPDAFFHIGDSLTSDYIKAVRRGWGALHLPVTRAERRAILTDHERTLADLLARGIDVRGRVAQPK